MDKISAYQAFIEQEINNIAYPQHPAGLYEPVKYMMALGGKRMRPLLLLMANDMFGGAMENAIKPALAMEMFHNFTLIHDDLMDKAALRRGKTTVHHKWNDTTAILSGDVMLVQAYELLQDVAAHILPHAFSLFNLTAKKVCEGQQLDMDFEKETTVSIDAYIEMIGLKTAALLAGTLQMGALIAGASHTSQELMYKFGYQAGIAFQVQDDILDAFGNSGQTGKAVGGDIASGKKTYLAIKALELAEGETKDELTYLYTHKEMDAQSKICEVLTIYNLLEVQKYAEETRNIYFRKAMESLDQVPVNPSKKDPLIQLAEMLVNRVS